MCKTTFSPEVAHSGHIIVLTTSLVKHGMTFSSIAAVTQDTRRGLNGQNLRMEATESGEGDLSVRKPAESIFMPIIKRNPFFSLEDYKTGQSQCDPGRTANLFHAFYIFTWSPCLSNLLQHTLGKRGGMYPRKKQSGILERVLFCTPQFS